MSEFVGTDHKKTKRVLTKHVKKIKKDNPDYLSIIKTADNSSSEAAAISSSVKLPMLKEIIKSPGKVSIRMSKRLAEKTPYKK